MNRLYAAFLLLSVYLSGCATMAPGANQVTVTREASLVSGCKVIGPVDTGVVFQSTFHDFKYALQNLGVAMGADTVLITSSRINNWTKQGIGYRCQS